MSFNKLSSILIIAILGGSSLSQAAPQVRLLRIPHKKAATYPTEVKACLDDYIAAKMKAGMQFDALKEVEVYYRGVRGFGAWGGPKVKVQGAVLRVEIKVAENDLPKGLEVRPSDIGDMCNSAVVKKAESELAMVARPGKVMAKKKDKSKRVASTGEDSGDSSPELQSESPRKDIHKQIASSTASLAKLPTALTELAGANESNSDANEMSSAGSDGSTQAPRAVAVSPEDEAIAKLKMEADGQKAKEMADSVAMANLKNKSVVQDNVDRRAAAITNLNLQRDEAMLERENQNIAQLPAPMPGEDKAVTDERDRSMKLKAALMKKIPDERRIAKLANDKLKNQLAAASSGSSPMSSGPSAEESRGIASAAQPSPSRDEYNGPWSPEHYAALKASSQSNSAKANSILSSLLGGVGETGQPSVPANASAPQMPAANVPMPANASAANMPGNLQDAAYQVTRHDLDFLHALDRRTEATNAVDAARVLQARASQVAREARDAAEKSKADAGGFLTPTLVTRQLVAEQQARIAAQAAHNAEVNLDQVNKETDDALMPLPQAQTMAGMQAVQSLSSLMNEILQQKPGDVVTRAASSTLIY